MLSTNQQLSTLGENPPTESAGGETQRLSNETMSTAAQSDQQHGVKDKAAADKQKVCAIVRATC